MKAKQHYYFFEEIEGRMVRKHIAFGEKIIPGQNISKENYEKLFGDKPVEKVEEKPVEVLECADVEDDVKVEEVEESVEEKPKRRGRPRKTDK